MSSRPPIHVTGYISHLSRGLLIGDGDNESFTDWAECCPGTSLFLEHPMPQLSPG